MIRFWMAVSPEGQEPPAPPGALETCIDHVVAGARYRVALRPTPPEASGKKFVLSAGRAHEAASPDEPAPDDAVVSMDPASGMIEVLVGLLCPIHLFLTRQERTLLLANDLRLLPRDPSALDERGVFSLLQFGAVVAPFTLWKDIRRIEPGTRLTISPPGFDVSEEPIPLPAPAAHEGVPGLEEQEEMVRTALDDELRRACGDGAPVLLFSGGVDSGLLAARLRALGCDGARLVNYSRWEGDPEAELARAMAGHLGLALEVVPERAEAWDAALEAVGASYSHPFGDFATFPSLHLVNHVLADLPADGSTLLDGCGADGVLGGFQKLSSWATIYRFPKIFRWAMGFRYNLFRFWMDDHRLARWMGRARISSQMDLLPASVIAENPLHGVSFHVSRDARREVHDAIARAIRDAVPAGDFETRARGLDVLHVVRDMMAQKAVPVALGRPLDVVFPFLAPPIFRIGMEEAHQWPEQHESKAVLKRLLARYVPRDMVYRPKSGPEPPIREQFRRPATRGAFQDVVLSRGNPLGSFLETGPVKKMARLALDGHRFPHTTVNFLWTLLFTSLWLDQAGLPGPGDPGTPAG